MKRPGVLEMLYRAIAIAAFAIGLWMLIGCAVTGVCWLITALPSLT